MKVYISIPISGHDELKQRARAAATAETLRAAGHEPVNPFDIDAGPDPGYADYLCADLRVLAGCDAIYLSEGWQFSRGCRIEAAFAKEFNIRFLREGRYT